MRIEQILEKFDLFAQAPGAVERMREVVLELAVRGKLVLQDIADEPASELLKRILAEKSRQAGRDERMTSDPGQTPNNEQFEVPVNWVWIGATTPAVKVSDQGKKVQTKDILNSGKFPVVDQGKMFIRGFCDDSEKVISAVEPIVLFGDHTRETKFIDFDFVVGADGVKLLKPIFINPRFYFLMLRWLPLESRGYARHFKLLKAARIPLPPLAEQKRIVAKVDELMAICDRLEAQLRERDTRHGALARAALARFAAAPTPDNLQYLFHPAYDIASGDIRKSIFRLAVHGKLVPQSPNDENARVMIDRAMKLRRETIKSKSLRRKELDESGNLHKNDDFPSLWCIERLANLVDPENTISYGVLVPGNDVPDGIPFVRAQDLCLSQHPARPNKTIAPDIERPYARTRLTGGEILLCVVGSIGKIGVVPDSWAGANIARAVARIKPIPDVLRDYLLIVLLEQSVQEHFASTTRTLAQPTLNVGMIEQTLIPIPPLAEQRRIVAQVDHLMSLVDRYESQLTTARATAARLLDALVAEITGSRRPGSLASSSAAQSPRQTKALANEERPQPPSERSAAPAGGTPAIPGRIDGAGLLALLRDRGSLSSSEAQAATGLDPATLRGLFKTLIDQRLARTVGQRRGMRYLPTAVAAQVE